MCVQPSLMGLVWDGTSAGPMLLHFPSLLEFPFIFKDLFGGSPAESSDDDSTFKCP